MPRNQRRLRAFRLVRGHGAARVSARSYSAATSTIVRLNLYGAKVAFGGNPWCVLDQEPQLAERVAHIERAPRLLGRILAYASLAPALPCLCGCTSTLNLGSNDAGVLYDADCKPGTYAGSTSDGSLFAFVPSGPIAVTLVPIGTDTLALGPDASLSSPLAGIDGTRKEPCERRERRDTSSLNHLLRRSAFWGAETKPNAPADPLGHPDVSMTVPRGLDFGTAGQCL